MNKPSHSTTAAVLAGMFVSTSLTSEQKREQGRAERDRARGRCTTCHKKPFDCRCGPK